MIRALLLALTALFPFAAHAQQPPSQPPSAQSSAAEFAAQVCRLLSTTVTERDALQAQVAAVQKQLDEARAQAKTAEGKP